MIEVLHTNKMAASESVFKFFMFDLCFIVCLKIVFVEITFQVFKSWKV